jgi:tetratricopeptide (TPR) repeat protein
MAQGKDELPMNTPKIFISYAHSSPERKQTVADLAGVLRSKGLIVSVDTDVKTPQGPGEGWPKWMKRQLRDADWVLLFFDQTYRRRFDGEELPNRGLGAMWEGAIITHHHYREGTINRKFIPLLADGASADLIPDELFGYNCYYIPGRAVELAAILSTAASTETPAAGPAHLSPGTPVPKRRIEITLDEDLANFGPEQQQRFVGAVVTLLNIADVTIKHIGPGSVKVTLEVPADKAEQLKEAVMQGRLAAFHARFAALADGDDVPVPELQFASIRLPLQHLTGVLEGRKEEFAMLDAAWAGAPKRNVIALVAWGGVGKTSLVMHWRHRLFALPDRGGVQRYFDWSFYTGGTRPEGGPRGVFRAASADLFLKEALEFFGDPALAASDANARKKGDRLAQIISQHRTLLILDGIEALQDTETGALRDDTGIKALILRLADHNRGLCLITTRLPLPDLNTWHHTTALERKLDHLTDEAGAAVLKNLGVEGTHQERRDLSAKVKGHALTLTLLGGYLKSAHQGDIHRADSVDFTKVNLLEQGGHAFRVIAAYERWFKEGNRHAELAVLRMLGLFDRPATPDCLAALRSSDIAGLTHVLASTKDEDWNVTVNYLGELGLLEEKPCETRPVTGYSEEDVKRARQGVALGEPKSFERTQCATGRWQCLDAHPLIRGYFAQWLRETSPATWKAAHRQLFDQLAVSVPYWPEGLPGLEPLYQAVAHGCCAGAFQEALRVFRDRIRRGSWHYSFFNLGALGQDRATLSGFFEEDWKVPVGGLDASGRAYVLNEAGSMLRARGKADEAVWFITQALEIAERNGCQEAAPAARNLSQTHMALGHLQQAERFALKSIDLAENDWLNTFLGLSNHGRVLHLRGELDAAAECFRKMDDMKKGRLSGLPAIHYVDFLVTIGQAEQALPLALASLDVALDRHSIRDTGLAQLGLALVYKALDHPKEAHCHIEQAVERLGESLRQDELPLAFLLQAELHRERGGFVNRQKAQARLHQALGFAERGKLRLVLADYYIESCKLWLHEQAAEKAEQDLGRARATINETGYHSRDHEIRRLAERLSDAAQAGAAAEAEGSGLGIDITPYGEPGATAVVFQFTESQWKEPLPTLKAFATYPGRFVEGAYRIRMTRTQEDLLLAYLRRGQDFYFRQSFGTVPDGSCVLAVSFGAGPAVNAELASELQKTARRAGQADIYAQWEIADTVCKLDPSLRGRIHSIGLDSDSDYITTARLVEKCVLDLSRRQRKNPISVFLVAQAWHAARIIRICHGEGLPGSEVRFQVIGGSFVDRFSKNDPQPWVRDAFAWILKEGTKGAANSETDVAGASPTSQSFDVFLSHNGKDGPTARQPKVAPSRLPHAAERLVGREGEVRRLEEAWENPLINVITIVAWGGVGKTSLVAHWHAELAKAA